MEDLNLLDAIEKRHSVRKYKDQKIDEKTKNRLLLEKDRINKESGLNIQITFNDKAAFKGAYIGYGMLTNVSNYITLIGKKEDGVEEKIGYFGEELVLIAQSLGLNTCWVASTFNKRNTKYTLGKGEKLYCVIALGYGETQGKAHRSISSPELFDYSNDPPQWYLDGIKTTLLAPTARNQQKYWISYEGGNKVKAVAQKGPYSILDLGIVKKHFEIGAGKENFVFV